MSPSDIVAEFARSHPALFDWMFWIYIGGAFVSHVIRVWKPNEIDRSDTVRLIAAIADACSFTFLTAAKELGRKLGS